MDPHVIFDCEKALPNRFVLVLAAAARTRALNRGAEPRLALGDRNAGDLALQEIAAGAFSEEELAPFLLPHRAEARLLPAPSTISELCGDGRSKAAAAPAASPTEAVH
ncbi:DNA-directed RNA polymerase subunit omega (plasmid) [Brucella anthropi]|uniref:DNA-directed RNA polymerase subunit omega n=1 Tax=Brucella anthropi (strain ATCC 49188 / DSM 6882 / CCUG 24695 / JCM 21032 / LMG 3331 / NBRC 15819 / NCTC 12168 / Alc 37) TaxID=439375 RepID=A6X7W0_BRUA4|nr:DNA-directed RNA polymerase subunit omega [Brucella anthropi]ABS17314.1 DNA-directed RNA polymerase, omega subunit [Brucella anthropi ATCC 49188]KAB2723410.1 DNA-directed RNA polymerase subunit omega [Brucella anthropi]QQC26823.1 DNA-directed RNA polymerase subunit omega [Brucella anthropi]SUB55845.1 DNA-directed RNA polymerase subunit omega [Brucella anthropi]